MGPGCEGKSTALYQIVHRLVEPDKFNDTESKYQIIWWEDPEFDNFKKKFLLLEKPETEKKWLIVTDLATPELIKEIHDLFYGKEPLPRRDITFLLSCRTAFWEIYGEKFSWDRGQKYKQTEYKKLRPIGKLTRSEAQEIAEKWEEFGILEKTNKNEVIKELLKQHESEKPAFLAAILLCKGKTLDQWLRERIDQMLVDIADTKKTNNLLFAYACIVAMHQAEELRFLRQKVLAQAIEGYDSKNLKNLRDQILKKLGDEIVFSYDNRNEVVVTRHQTIAEAVYTVLSEKYNIDFSGDIYPKLAKAAQELVEHKDKLIKNKGKEINDWQYKFPGYFAEKDPDLAIRIAESLFEIGFRHGQLLTNLSRLCRDNGDFETPIERFREEERISRQDRKYYHEWAVAELKYNKEKESDQNIDDGNYANAVYLCAIALSDSIYPKLDTESTVIYLCNMGLAFWHLSMKSNDVYAKALGASAQLALGRINKANFKKPDEKNKTIENLKRNLNERAKRLNVGELDIQTKFQALFKRILRGIKAAYEQSQREGNQDESKKLPDRLESLSFNKLEFESLEDILKG